MQRSVKESVKNYLLNMDSILGLKGTPPLLCGLFDRLCAGLSFCLCPHLIAHSSLSNAAKNPLFSRANHSRQTGIEAADLPEVCDLSTANRTLFCATSRNSLFRKLYPNPDPFI